MSDKTFEIVPSLQSTWNLEIFERLKSDNPNYPVFLNASYDGEDQKCVFIQAANDEKDLIPVRDHLVEHKSRKKWSIERMLKDLDYVKRFSIPGRRFTWPPFTTFQTETEESEFETTFNGPPSSSSPIEDIPAGDMIDKFPPFPTAILNVA